MSALPPGPEGGPLPPPQTATFNQVARLIWRHMRNENVLLRRGARESETEIERIRRENAG